MKKFKGLIVILIVAVVMTALVACPRPTPPEGHDFTVTVYDVDGSPCDWLKIQACEVGNAAVCYPAMKKTDENGVAFLDIGDNPATEIPSSVQSIDIHLIGLPDYLTFDALVLNRGESGTINLRYKTDAELDAVSGGTGVGAYLTGDDANKIDRTEGAFDPYGVANGSYYRLKFTSADQKIYFAFNANRVNDYKVFVVGGIDVKIVELIEQEIEVEPVANDVPTELVNDGEHEQSGVDCEYEFSTDAANQVVYFEVSLANAADVNKEAIICFESN